jgi:type IV pilus assembly protein PilY1
VGCLNDSTSTCSVYSGTRPRPPVVYTATNDGMLHAFNGATGAELWAFIPSVVMPNLYRLADLDYANRHIYTVDGSPVVSDVYDSVAGKWRTILVAGLNSGGRGYYALDITDPAAPIALWEFSARAASACPSTVVLNTSKDDCDLGYTYGNPVFTKLSDGTWVVLVTSGYNNVSPGDGKGYLYVMNPVTGVIIKKIQASNTAQALSPGSSTTPAGLAKIANFVNDITTNNTTLRIYGGDLQGNLWRFDPSAGTAYAIALLQDGSAVAQPVTTKPELGEITSTAGTTEMVYVGTGLFLGVTDTASTQQQTIYGIKDSSNGTALVPVLNARTSSTVKAQTLTNAVDAQGNAFRQVTSNTVDVTASGTNGWRVDLPVSGERVNVDPLLQLGTLAVASNVPANTVCAPGGFSFVNFLDYRTGSYVPGQTSAGMSLPNYLTVGLTAVQLPDGSVKLIITGSGGQITSTDLPVNIPKLFGRRVGWRELMQ